MIQKPTFKWFGYLLAISGVLGLLASSEITVDKFNILTNPHFVPSCSINPVISCGTIMQSAQAAVFGFPNPIPGIIGFSAVLVVGMSLIAGAGFKNWYWRLFNLGSLLGLIFVHWLIFQSLYVIQALCPWCIVAWIVTAATFWYTLLDNLSNNRLWLNTTDNRYFSFVRRYHAIPLVIWYVVVATLAVTHFWYFFGAGA